MGFVYLRTAAEKKRCQREHRYLLDCPRCFNTLRWSNDGMSTLVAVEHEPECREYDAGVVVYRVVDAAVAKRNYRSTDLVVERVDAVKGRSGFVPPPARGRS